MHILLFDNLSSHSDRSFICELDSVNDKVDEDLLKPFSIRMYHESIFKAHYRFQFKIPCLRLELTHRESLIDEFLN